MVYTLTLNPAIDYVVEAERLEIGKINRCEKEDIYYGGKGINVSLILSELGIKSVATGFVAGFTGEFLEKGIENENIKSDFVKSDKGFTRINVKIRHGEETDINAKGPTVVEEDLKQLFQKLSVLTKGDILVLSGSVPAGVPQNIYEVIMEHLKDKEIKFIIDARNQLLLNSLKYNPFLIKPNEEELGEIFSTQIKDSKDALKYAGKLKEMGAENVLVSLGDKGAILLSEKREEFFESAHKGKTVNTVGAGDSMLAGFIAGYLLKGDYGYALKLGTAAGGATAFSKGLAQRDKIITLMQQ